MTEADEGPARVYNEIGADMSRCWESAQAGYGYLCTMTSVFSYSRAQCQVLMEALSDKS